MHDIVILESCECTSEYCMVHGQLCVYERILLGAFCIVLHSCCTILFTLQLGVYAALMLEKINVPLKCNNMGPCVHV